MDIENIDGQISKLMDKATKSYLEKEKKEKGLRTIKEVYVDSIEDVVDRKGVGEATLESEIIIPEIYIDKDKETRDFLKKLGYVNANPKLYGLSVEFGDGVFTTVVDGEIEIEGEIYKTHGEDMGMLKVITTINKKVNLKEIRNLFLTT